MDEVANNGQLYAVMVVNEDKYLGEEQGLPKLFNTIDVYLVNDTDLLFPMVKVLTGAFASDDNNLIETSKLLRPAVELSPHSTIAIGKSDTGELDFIVWYDVDMLDDNGKRYQFRFSLLKHRWQHKSAQIPLLDKSGYRIDLKAREGVSVKEWVQTHDMKSRYLDYDHNTSFPDFK